MTIILDGPLGTELTRRGVATTLPTWSAMALQTAPHVVAAIHADYAAAGATVHTANTFRTQQRTIGADWQRWTNAAVQLALGAVPADHLVFGSLAPLEDCYRPDRSPRYAGREHRAMAAALSQAGCHGILCETFPHVGEATVATEAAVRTGLPVWVAFTAGPSGDLLTPQQMAAGAKQVVSAGAAAVLVNCTPACQTLAYVEAIRDAVAEVPVGAYANAGSPEDAIGWEVSQAAGGLRYTSLAMQWRAAGASLIGGCCGTGPAHIAALAEAFEQA